jgi:positive regulator of sigma E activity
VSNISEIKGHIDRLSQLGNSMREQFMALKGPEGEELKRVVKDGGTRAGIGVGISVAGLMLAAVALIYSMAVVILIVNLALDRLWLSSLIVVGGFLIIGGAAVALGARMAKSYARGLAVSTEHVTTPVKAIAEDMKTEVEGLQDLLKKEAEERQKKMKEMAETAKKAAPTAAPLAVGGLVVGWVLKRAMRSRREKRRIMKVIDMYEEAKTSE